MIGKIVSHYKIVEKLGEGGMGVVYKAEDIKLQRPVALKFLPPELTSDPDAKERFIQEARAASALDHPSICTIHEVDETEEGQLFICMAFCGYKSLKDKIKEGPLSLDEAISIATRIARGLAKAHNQGVVHRDIKPANLLLDDEGQVKLVDFGLAKLAGEARLTKVGTTMGTVAYMSPEQARGEDVDHRADIWALGVILFEMVTGRLPYQSDYEQALIYSILNEEPPPLSDYRPDAPPELEAIILRALEKDPEKRYASAAEMVEELSPGGPSAESRISRITQTVPPADAVPPRKRSRLLLAGGGVLVAALLLIILRLVPLGGGGESGECERKMLAVLPLANLGPPEDEYFADGITDAITARLAGIHGLGVISRQSATQYKKSTLTTLEIGKELGVDYILQGSIQRERPSDPSSNLRITPNLVRVSDDINIWVDMYDEDMTEVFRVQSEIAERVARALDITLLEPERQSLESRPTDDLEAYEHYLRGNDSYNRRLAEKDAQTAVEMYEKAVELDPEFAEAWAALARARVWLKWNFGHEDQLTLAEAAAEEASRLGPDLTETHMAWGDFYYYGSRDYDKALQHFTTVQRWQPSEAEALASIGWIRRREGQWEESVAHLVKALELNPRDPTLTHGIGQTYLRMGEYGEAEHYLDRGISLVPHVLYSYVDKAILYLNWDESPDRARVVMETAIAHVAPEEFLSVSPLMLIRIFPDLYEQVLSELSLASPGIDTPSDTIFFFLVQGELERERDDASAANAHFDSARVYLESRISQRPSSGYLHSLLGLAYAGLGEREKAIAEGRRGSELLPMTKDALSGPYMIERLAEAAAKVGDRDCAVEQLQILVTNPTRISASILRVDPLWGRTLSGHPGFRRLLRPQA